MQQRPRTLTLKVSSCIFMGLRLCQNCECYGQKSWDSNVDVVVCITNSKANKVPLLYLLKNSCVCVQFDYIEAARKEPAKIRIFPWKLYKQFEHFVCPKLTKTDNWHVAWPNCN